MQTYTSTFQEFNNIISPMSVESANIWIHGKMQHDGWNFVTREDLISTVDSFIEKYTTPETHEEIVNVIAESVIADKPKWYVGSSAMPQ